MQQVFEAFGEGDFGRAGDAIREEAAFQVVAFVLQARANRPPQSISRMEPSSLASLARTRSGRFTWERMPRTLRQPSVQSCWSP